MFLSYDSPLAQDTFSWEDQVIYFILIDRFHNGDKTNDFDLSPKNNYGFHGGDIRGIIQKLPYLKNLGVTVLWLSPIFDNRDDRFFQFFAYHGYWVKDFYKVDEHFGTMKDIQELSKKAKEYGIHLMIDMIVNHVDYNAKLVKEKPSWFHTYPEIKNWQSTFELENHKVHGLPDLAQENPEVEKFLIDNAKWWIDKIKPIGFRLDAVKHVPLSFWKKYNKEISKYAGKDFFILGEILDGNPETCIHSIKTAKFHSLFDFPLYFVMKRVFAENGSTKQFGELFHQDRFYPNPNHLATLLDNHDLERFFSTVKKDIKTFKLALKFMFLVRGIPTLYYGTEIALDGKHEPDNRRDMNFKTKPDVRAYVKKLIMTRRNTKALSKGQQIHLYQTNHIYAFARVWENEIALVILNNDKKEKKVTIPVGLLSPYIENSKPKSIFLKTEADMTQKYLKTTIAGKSCVLFIVKPKQNCTLLIKSYRSLLKKPNMIPVDFYLTMKGKPQTVHIIGGDKLLGKWNHKKAPGKMKYMGNGKYHLQLKLPCGSILKYKYIIKNKGKVVWELGLDNRYIEVPWKKSIQTDDIWNHLKKN